MHNTVFAVALTGLFIAGSANAVPCGSGMASGGVFTSVACANGAPGDLVDTAADLNAGNFFGSSSWQQLDRTDDGLNTAFWNVNPATGTGVMGTFTLAAGIWNSYSQLAVAVSSSTPTESIAPGIQWSAYLLPANAYGTYLWTFDWQRSVSNLSLYAVDKATRVAEPATLALVLTGLLALFMANRRRSTIG